MKISIRGLAVGISLACSGCAIHPNTEDFSRNTIPEIIHKVRCEAQDSIRTLKIDRSSRLIDTAVGFDFEFTLTETNVADVGGSFIVPISLGAFTMGYSAGATKDRQAVQKVKFSDSFGELLYNLHCDDPKPRPSIIYPITGQIGLLPTFHNFVEIERSQAGDDLDTFTDEVKFTTTLSAGVSPRVDLAPSVGRAVAISGNYKVTRTDMHRVSIGFDAPSTPEQSEGSKNKKLDALRFERSLPYKVQIVDEHGNPIAVRGLGSPSARPETFVPQNGGRAPRGSARPFVPSPTLQDRKKRVLQKLEESRTQILNRQLLERIR